MTAGERERGALRRTLTTTSLVFVMFFTVSGGAYTLEGLVATVGPGLALLALVVLPLLYSLPETLIIGELASALPEEGGYYRWVRRAFGPFWGFQNGWITWVYSMVDMAIYPVLFTTYLRWFVPELSAAQRWIVSLAVIWIPTAINLRGAINVGRASVAVGSYVLAGFFALAVVALPHATHAPWVPFALPGETLGGGLAVALSTALWNYIGWDNASTVQGEVHDPSRTYPRSLAIALPLVTLGYLVPMLATLSATEVGAWHEGGWPALAATFGPVGRFLAVWIAIGGMLSALALFNALLMTYSRVPLALASDGLLPARLATTDARGTPVAAVLVSAVCYSLFALLPFGELVVADVVLYSLALTMELFSLVRLRRTEPGLRGAFRVRTGRGGILALALLPLGVLLGVVVLSVLDGEIAATSLGGAVVAVALGPLWYAAARRRLAA